MVEIRGGHALPAVPVGASRMPRHHAEPVRPRGLRPQRGAGLHRASAQGKTRAGRPCPPAAARLAGAGRGARHVSGHGRASGASKAGGQPGRTGRGEPHVRRDARPVRHPRALCLPARSLRRGRARRARRRHRVRVLRRGAGAADAPPRASRRRGRPAARRARLCRGHRHPGRAARRVHDERRAVRSAGRRQADAVPPFPRPLDALHVR